MIALLSYTFAIVILIIMGIKWYSFNPHKHKKKAELRYENVRLFSYKEFINKSKILPINKHKPVLLEVRFFLKRRGIELEFYLHRLKGKTAASHLWNTFYIKDFYHKQITPGWLNTRYYTMLKFLFDYVRNCTYEEISRNSDVNIDLMTDDKHVSLLSMFVRQYILALYDNKGQMEDFIDATAHKKYTEFLDTPRSIPYITHIQLKFYYKTVRDYSVNEDIIMIKRYIESL